ncbi:MAG TPA: ABC transporter substrate-binding protein, partial [Candidatus Bathyarchaeia archaeon]|nr:ABC transporter substrate-binding protein [Candidatus Bathyarchaeia archaeon]
TSMVTSIIFEGLTTLDATTLEVKPQLAERWTVSEDGKTWTFYLRRDVRWNDGEPLSADDVVFTFNELIYNDQIPSSARDVLSIEGKEFVVTKVDDYTVQFSLPVKFAPFLSAMTQEILPKHCLEKSVADGDFTFAWGIDTPPARIVGTGAFRLARYLPGERIVFERNPYYWKRSAGGDALPYLDGMIFLIVQNQDAVVLKFLEGEVDYCAVRGIDYPLLKPLEEKKNFTLYEAGPDFGTNFLVLNQNRGVDPKSGKPFVEAKKLAWFTDLNFRRALAHAIDQQKMIEIVKSGLGYPQIAAMSQSAGFFYNPNVATYSYDLAKAAEILSQAGYRDRNGDGIIEDPAGNPVEFNLYTNAGNPERERIAAMIRRDLGQLGMKVNFLGMEFNALIQKLNASYDWDAVILGLTGGIEPHFGKNVWHSTGQLHLWYPNQSAPASEWERRIDEIFDQGVQELDPARRKLLYDEWQVIVSEQLPLIYTILGSNMFAVRNKFGNLYPTSYGGAFHNIEEIYLSDK